jgi:3-deoxy-D-manno-octulosonic-acid transferase
LGARPEAVRVTGNQKFDAAPAELPPKQRQRLRLEYGIGPDDPVLIFGSTRPGDETLAADCWQNLRQKHPRLRLIIAPRHLDRVAEALAAFGGAALRRSEWPRATPRDPRAVLLLDTHGELVDHYAIASLAVIGGSFYPGVEGHNPIEPAALGIPVVFGPHMKNFAEPAALLREGGGARQLPGPDALCGALEALLADPPALQRMGTLARRTVLDQRGATARNVALITGALRGDAARP